MAMETIGLGGRLTFDPQAGVAGLNRAAKAFEGMQRRSQRAAAGVNSAAGRLKESLGKAGEGLKIVGAAAIPMSIGMGLGVAKAASFEKQMSNLRSIMRGASQEEFQMLQEESKRLGIVSVFSAQQAGEAMENLAVLGLKPLEVMTAIGPTLDAAAVAGIDLASAALYVGGTTRAMGLEIAETARVADVLTVAGQKSATTLPLMAEALKLAAPSAKSANLSLEETVSLLGKMADAQLRGTLGATAFNNMMAKMAKPTREAEKILEDMNVTFSDAQGKWRPIIDIVNDVNMALQRETNAVERSRKEVELFGIRGARGFSALASAGVESTKELQNALENSLGAAQESAEIRLDNIMGAFTLFGASLEGVAIGLFTPFLEAGKGAVKGITESLNTLLLALEDVRRPLREGEKEYERLFEANKKFGVEAVDVAEGISEAIDTMVGFFKSATEALTDFGVVAKDTFGTDTREEFAKYVTLFAFMAAVVGPLALGLLAVGWALKGMVLLAAPLPALFGLLGAVWTWMATTTVPAFLLSLKGVLLFLQLTAIVALQNALAFLAMAAPILIVVAALALFIGFLHATQLEGETLIESFVKNWQEGMKHFVRLTKNVALAIANFITKPLQLAVQGFVALQEFRGKKVSASLKAFGEKGFQAAPEFRTMAVEERPGAGRLLPPRQAGRGIGGARVERGAGDILGELQKQVGGGVLLGKGGGRDPADRFATEVSKMMLQNQEAIQATAEVAKAVADEAKRKKDTRVNIDGREVARATAKSQEEVEARSGAKTTPWQRHQAVVHGAIPTRR